MEDRKSLEREKVPQGRRLSQDKLPSLQAVLPPAWSPESSGRAAQGTSCSISAAVNQQPPPKPIHSEQAFLKLPSGP